MGCVGSTPTETTPAEREAHKAIEQGLKQDRQKATREVKILLLGAGESGKSTFAKQMRFLYGEGFNEDDRRLYKGFVTSHLLTSFRILLFSITSSNLVSELGMDAQKEELSFLLQPELDASAGGYFEFVVLHVDKLRESVTKLWAIPAVQKYLVENKSQLQIFDTADFFFEEASRVLDKSFVPTDTDILCCRVRTTGILEYFFNIERGLRIQLIDVGGQRSERRKWIHCFEGVSSVVFFASLSEYDQSLFEDQRQNRMRESLQLFRDACGSSWFNDSTMILFLNKIDLFKKKIQTVDLNVCFKSYTDGCNYEKALNFISARFQREAAASNKPIYVHVTCATDREMVKKVFDDVKESIFKKMMLHSV
mmetsp:Transcript_29150/g.45089  ORF Transcript_29150/g.45089 Transcript_29150/m.45089 type:complete len:366 (-) Transcript_29150:92-1189(-)